jgi:hypothetical protein
MTCIRSKIWGDTASTAEKRSSLSSRIRAFCIRQQTSNTPPGSLPFVAIRWGEIVTFLVNIRDNAMATT